MRRESFRSWGIGAVLLALLCVPAGSASAQEITYTFSGIIRVLDLSSPPPGEGVRIPGVDPLGLGGAAVLLECAIDSATVPSFTGTNGDGTFAFYNAGVATLAITGSVLGGVDGTYVDMPCSVRVDDFPDGSTFGGDKLGVTTTWNLGLPFPVVFQVPFAELGQSTFAGNDLQTFAATDVRRFSGVNFGGSNDVFYFDRGSPPLPPAQRISGLIEAVEALPGLPSGVKRSLIVELEPGRERSTIHLLRLFSRQIARLVDRGRITPESGEALIDEATAIVEQTMGAGGRARTQD